MTSPEERPQDVEQNLLRGLLEAEFNYYRPMVGVVQDFDTLQDFVSGGLKFSEIVLAGRSFDDDGTTHTIAIWNGVYGSSHDEQLTVFVDDNVYKVSKVFEDDGANKTSVGVALEVDAAADHHPMTNEAIDELKFRLDRTVWYKELADEYVANRQGQWLSKLHSSEQEVR